MTLEEKDLLLKDLCGRLPYGLKFPYHMDEDSNHKECDCIAVMDSICDDTIEFTYNENKSIRDWTCHITEVKPYLRPMSSMTEEEKKECCSIFNYSMYQFEVNKYGDVESTEPTVEKECLYYDAELMAKWLDWLNSRHFDFRNLIEKGLALEAPEEMYKTK